MTPDHQIAVLGGGIAGCIVACELDDLGYDVVIVEQRDLLMDGASRWNDGKIHLGYTFIGTSSLATAKLMQQGAAVFFGILERTIGEKAADSWFGKPTLYVVDRESLFDVETLWTRTRAVAELLLRSAESDPRLRRFAPSDRPLLERLTVEDAEGQTGQQHITGGWRTTELHVSTREIATRLRRAVAAREVPVLHARVERVEAAGANWRAVLSSGDSLVARAAVNCLWENRAVVDRQVAPALPGEPPVSIRYKRCLFGTGTGLQDINPSTRILGRFGDIAAYGNGDAYLSWYPAALAGRSEDGIPPTIVESDPEDLLAATLDGLGLPRGMVASGSWKAGGGYIVAQGAGDIDDARTLLHTRNRAGVRELLPGFVSIDTGKYTLGPLLGARAAQIARRRMRALAPAELSRRRATA